MDKWIKAKDLVEARAILSLLTKYDFNGSTSYYHLSNPKCIHIDFDSKYFKVGCRLSEWTFDSITLSDLVGLLTGYSSLVKGK